MFSTERTLAYGLGHKYGFMALQAQETPGEGAASCVKYSSLIAGVTGADG